MKIGLKYLVIVGCSLITTTLSAQTDGFNYQAVARDSTGKIIANDSLNVRLTILQGAGMTEIYKETHAVVTNQFGLFEVVVGQGTSSVGDFTTITWSADEHHLKVEVDFGNGFIELGTSQLLSVPYALYAKSTGGSVSSPWTSSGSDIHFSSGDVGIGTSSPGTFSGAARYLTLKSSSSLSGTKTMGLELIGSSTTIGK